MSNHAETMIRQVMASDSYRTAVATLAAEHDRTVEDIIALTQIAAPSFQEATRGSAFRAMAEAHGLKNLQIDAEGNVTGLRPGIGNGPLICVAAHLDTVFPPGTDLAVRREGTRLYAPGVGDDTRSLAVLLAWLRAMDAAGVQTRADILFVADVGEEGPGDLRGMRHLFLFAQALCGHPSGPPNKGQVSPGRARFGRGDQRLCPRADQHRLIHAD